jgi:hypothetical protein
LRKAVAELDGEIASVKFDPDDPQSIEQAIQTLNSAIDAKIAQYSRNDMVTSMAEELKENGRNAILERAAAARLERGQE